MSTTHFLRSGLGRLTRVVVGVALIYYGATHPSLLGLVLMMAGMVPAVTGFADICLLDEVHVTRRPHEGRV